MTAKRDLKRRVRERQARTGESYVTALRNVRGQRPKPFEVEELFDLTDVAAPLGIKCRVTISSTIADRVEAAQLLERLRAVLVATERDRTMELMRAVVLHGEHRKPVRSTVIRQTLATFEKRWRFLDRARAGIGGINEDGDMLAMAVEGRDGMVNVLFRIEFRRTGAPSLEIHALGDPEPGGPTLTW